MQIRHPVLLQVLIWYSLLFCVCCFADETKIYNMVSPKLRQFVTDHPKARYLLTNAISEAFSNRQVQVYYFYSDDETVAKAYHYYPNDSAVGICICENQQPIDEFTSLIFEALNSENESAFRDLSHQVELGNISKTNYARQVMELEFRAATRSRDMLINLNPTEAEISASHSYKHFIKCPDKFEDFIKYTEIVSPGSDPLKQYEAQYDMLRRR